MTTPAEAGQVLAKLALNDPFFPKPDAGMAVAWAETFSVHQLALEHLLAAVPLLFADEKRTRDRVLPIDVIVKARKIRADQLDRDPALREALLEWIDTKVARIESRPSRGDLAAIERKRAAGDDVHDAEVVDAPVMSRVDVMNQIQRLAKSKGI